MPYIITTRTFSDPGVQTIWSYSRRAVATLKEARTQIHGYRMRFYDPRVSDTVHDIPEAGGTIGPLPDGTVIELEQVEWDQLALQAGLTYPGAFAAAPFPNFTARHEIIDAYNAQAVA